MNYYQKSKNQSNAITFTNCGCIWWRYLIRWPECSVVTCTMLRLTLSKPGQPHFSTGSVHIEHDGCMGSSLAQAHQRGLLVAEQIIMSHYCLLAAACVLLPHWGQESSVMISNLKRKLHLHPPCPNYTASAWSGEMRNTSPLQGLQLDAGQPSICFCLDFSCLGKRPAKALSWYQSQSSSSGINI